MTSSASAAREALTAADVAHLRHELRTPVNQIVGYCEMLLEDADTEATEHVTRRRHLTAAIEAVTEVRGLIDRGLSSAATLTFADVDGLRATLLGPRDRICAAMDELLASEGDEAVITDARRIRDAARRLTTTDASAVNASPAPSGSPSVRQPQSATKHGARILVVDDIDENRVVLGRRLARDGHSVVAAANGLEALERAAAERFDVILLDVMMPELDGYETLIRLKSDAQTRDVPVIMISALDDIASIARCIERGADDYLPKPFDPVLLRARINASLEKNAARERERDFLRDVGLVAGAATAVTRGTYLAGGLGPVARRPDELGTLARVFDGMAAGIQQREARLRDQISRLREAVVGVSDAPIEMSSSSGEMLRPGDVLAERYTIDRLIGVGGMGMVYVASDLELGDRVALKTLRPELTTVDDTAVERFRNEIRLARRIAHRNIVRTHDFGKTNDIYFVTMELVSGTTLRAVLDQRGRLSVPAVLAIARQLAQALACAHEQGIIHRDIKPQNLLLDPDGTLKVMDFGVARLAQRASGLTQVGMVVGTPAYMAPEQLLDEDADVRSDLYAAGVVLYECLTGRRPYDARSPIALIGKILQGGAAPPSDVASDIAPSMDALVMELLARDRDERTPSARALGDALDLIGV